MDNTSYGGWLSGFNFSPRKPCEHLACCRMSMSHRTEQLWRGPFCGSSARALPPGAGSTPGKKECHLSTIWMEGSERKREKLKAVQGFLVWHQVRANEANQDCRGGLVWRQGLRLKSTWHRSWAAGGMCTRLGLRAPAAYIFYLSRKVGLLKRLQTLHFTLFYRQIANLL